MVVSLQNSSWKLLEKKNSDMETEQYSLSSKMSLSGCRLLIAWRVAASFKVKTTDGLKWIVAKTIPLFHSIKPTNQNQFLMAAHSDSFLLPKFLKSDICSIKIKI